MKRERLHRISCFAPGVPLAGQCERHYAPRTADRARILFRQVRRQVQPNGPLGRVVLHQGNLKHNSCTILREVTEWTRADDLTASHTAFESFTALLNAGGGYHPSLNLAIPGQRALADLYDDAQRRRGDPRRAFTYSLPQPTRRRR